MMKIIKIFIAVVALLAVSCGTSRAMELKLRTESDKLWLAIYNNSLDSIWVDKRLSIGDKVGWNEIVLKIVDAGGSEKRFAASIQLGPPEPGDRVNLRPRELVGRSYDISMIAECYQLVPGAYRLSAIYKGKVSSPDTFKETIASNEIELIINLPLDPRAQ